MDAHGARVVVIGGGTGTFTVLSGLKHYVQDLSAVVTMADDGGSSGVLRDEMGVLPPGDIRQCLVALSPRSHLMRELLNYRFESGQFKGHAFGNLFLTALEQVSGSFEEAVKAAEQILNISGRVIPVTTDDTRLTLEVNGHKVSGEQHVIETSFDRDDQPLLRLEPQAEINPDAVEAIAGADMIVIGPGDLYGSLIPNLLVRGMQPALVNSAATKVLVCNLINKPGQTDGFMAHDYVDELEKYTSAGFFDYVIYSNQKPPRTLLDKYAQDEETWVEHDAAQLKQRSVQGVGANVLSNNLSTPAEGDTLMERNLIRHDSQRLAKELMKLYFS